MECTTCYSGFALGTNGRCCHSTCLSCSGQGSTQCLTCSPGNYLSNGACLTCHASCSTCNGQSSNNCLTCSNGSTAVNGTCFSCHASCATCSMDLNEFACLTCNNPYSLSALNNCYFPCPAKHFKQIPIVPISQVCTSCHSTCNTCIGPLVSDCTSCPSNKPLDSAILATVYEDSG